MYLTFYLWDQQKRSHNFLLSLWIRIFGHLNSFWLCVCVYECTLLSVLALTLYNNNYPYQHQPTELRYSHPPRERLWWRTVCVGVHIHTHTRTPRVWGQQGRGGVGRLATKWIMEGRMRASRLNIFSLHIFVINNRIKIKCPNIFKSVK